MDPAAISPEQQVVFLLARMGIIVLLPKVGNPGAFLFLPAFP